MRIWTLKKSFDYYNVKIIETPTSIEVWEYLEKPVFYTSKQHKEKNNNLDELLKLDIDEKDKTALEEYDCIKRKKKDFM